MAKKSKDSNKSSYSPVCGPLELDSLKVMEKITESNSLTGGRTNGRQLNSQIEVESLTTMLISRIVNLKSGQNFLEKNIGLILMSQFLTLQFQLLIPFLSNISSNNTSQSVTHLSSSVTPVAERPRSPRVSSKISPQTLNLTVSRSSTSISTLTLCFCRISLGRIWRRELVRPLLLQERLNWSISLMISTCLS